MKKIIFCTLSLVFVFISIFTYKSALFAEQKTSSGYAVIKYNNSYLYKTPTLSESFINKFFLLEESYFVKVLNRPNDEFYQVEYLDICGYVKVDDIEFVIETPQNPYLNYVTMDIKSHQDVNLLKLPNGKNDNLNVLYQLPHNAKNLIYYGKISAIEQENYMGNVWYYCAYNLNGSNILGYVYAPYCHNLSPINKNSEVLTATSLNSFSDKLTLFTLSLKTENIIFIATIIPSFAFILILSFPRKNNKNLNYTEE